MKLVEFIDIKALNLFRVQRESHEKPLLQMHV